MRGFFQSDHHPPSKPARAAPVVHLVNGVLHSTPSDAQVACQAPKPILLNIGEAPLPYHWVPRVVEVSLMRIGNFAIVCLPGEFTTMSGRRLRRAVYETLRPAYGAGIKVVLSTLCNTYASYVTTYEEYQQQRYEGGSTLYGPHTLDAYIQTTVGLAAAMVDGRPVKSAAAPADMQGRLISLLPPVLLDSPHHGKAFGDVLAQPAARTYAPCDTVEAVFVAANPRNNIRRGGTFLEVQRLDPASGAWAVVHTDDDLCTAFLWQHVPDKASALSSKSSATVRWQVPAGVAAGKYRLVYNGDARPALLGGGVEPFQGASREFAVSS